MFLKLTAVTIKLKLQKKTTNVTIRKQASPQRLKVELPEHLLKCVLTLYLRVKSLPHLPQQNCLTSKCTGWLDFNSPAVQKRFGHSLQTNGFTPLCRRKCSSRWPLWLNFFWQMWHVNQVPSMCDFSRCVLSWWCHVKRSEQCLHEYGFAPVWIRTWCVVFYGCVYMTFVSLQGAGMAETFVTLWTLVWFVSSVDSHVTV